MVAIGLDWIVYSIIVCMYSTIRVKQFHKDGSQEQEEEDTVRPVECGVRSKFSCVLCVLWALVRSGAVFCSCQRFGECCVFALGKNGALVSEIHVRHAMICERMRYRPVPYLTVKIRVQYVPSIFLLQVL